MIAKIGKTKSVDRTIDYVLGEAKGRELEDGEESRAEVIGGQNFRYEVRDREGAYRAAEEMRKLRRDRENRVQRRGRPLKYEAHHMSLSWHPSETPDNEHMVATARDALKRLGMDRALSVFVRHRDRPHPHTHVISSRIDPDGDGKVFKDSWDHHRVQAWSLQYEMEHGHVRPMEYRLQRAQEMQTSLASKNLEIKQQLAMADQRLAALDAKEKSRKMENSSGMEMSQ